MDYLLTIFLDDFKQNSWYNGFEDYISCTEHLLQMTIDGDPFDEHTATPVQKAIGIAACLLLSLAAAFCITSYYVKQMNSVALGTDAEAFAGELSLTKQNDLYLNTTTTRVYDPPSDSGSRGSGGGSSSGSSRSGSF